MPNRTDEPRRRDDADWRHAWNAIGQLATARSILETDYPPSRIRKSVPRRGAADSFQLQPTYESAQAREQQLERDLAEIAAVTRALQRAEPSLEPWTARSETGQPRQRTAVWTLMGIVWAAACLVAVAVALAVLQFA